MPNRTRSGSQAPAAAAAAPAAPKKLLAAGNDKLGSSIKSFSLPHGDEANCPGLTPTCRKLCYVSRYTRRFNLDYKRNRIAADKADFVTKMSKEAALVRTVRVHVSGDFYNAAYVNKWIQIADKTPGTLFYAYTRSWRGRDLKMLEALVALSKRPNFILNISTDKDTGIPGWLFGAFGGSKRITYMAVNDQDTPHKFTGVSDTGQPARVNIVFRVKRTSKILRIGGSQVCPVEFGGGFGAAVTCEYCKLCFKPKWNPSNPEQNTSARGENGTPNISVFTPATAHVS